MRDRRKGRAKKEQEEEWRKKGNAGGKGMKGEKKRCGERWGWVIRSDADNGDGDEGELGCAFHRNSVGFRRKWDKRHRPFRNVTGTGTGMCYNTNLDIPVDSGWYLSARFLQVENARNYSKYVKISPNVGT